MWFRYEEALPIAYRQCLCEGKDVEADYGRMKAIADMAYGDPEKRNVRRLCWTGGKACR